MKVAKRKPKKAIDRRDLCVHVEVLQNGATLVSTIQPLARKGSFNLTSRGQGPFVLPHYPLPEGRLEFLRVTPTGVSLVVDHKWEGFCTAQGELINITRGDRGRRTLVLGKGDYASITADDLRIMIKIGPAAKKVEALRGTARAYRRSLLAHVLPTIEERWVFAIGAVIATFILGAATFGLIKRPEERPTSLADMSEEYVLPFVSPGHLKEAPEALQDKLDRRNAVKSVLEFYKALTAVFMGWGDYDSSYVLASTQELYQNLFSDAQALLKEKETRQREVDSLQAMKSDASILVVPAVRGETMAGSMLRVIDKINLMQEGFAANLAARREVVADFAKDPAYDWGEYKNVGNGNAKAQAYLAQIKPFERLTDEQMMYQEAETLSEKARLKQKRTLGHGIEIKDTAENPIGVPHGAKFVSFAADPEFALADEKLYQLQASEYGIGWAGSKASAIKEPLVGKIEPQIIERFIKENRYQLQLCYELALRRDEAAEGTMEWRWRVDSRGEISDVALVASGIRDQRMAECIRTKISAWRFPRPRRGSVEISYPFEFAPTKG